MGNKVLWGALIVAMGLALPKGMCPTFWRHVWYPKFTVWVWNTDHNLGARVVNRHCALCGYSMRQISMWSPSPPKNTVRQLNKAKCRARDCGGHRWKKTARDLYHHEESNVWVYFNIHQCTECGVVGRSVGY